MVYIGVQYVGKYYRDFNRIDLASLAEGVEEFIRTPHLGTAGCVVSPAVDGVVILVFYRDEPEGVVGQVILPIVIAGRAYLIDDEGVIVGQGNGRLKLP